MADAPKEYEFAEADNLRLMELHQKMSWVGWASCVFGLVGLTSLGVGLIRSGTQNLTLVLPLGVFSFVVLVTGAWTYKGALEFKGIAATEGSDISHLMKAVESLRKIYRLLYWVILAGVTIVLADAALGLLFPLKAA